MGILTMDVERLQRSLMECYSALNNLLLDYPKGLQGDALSQVKQLFEHYQELSQTGFIDGGNDIFASGIVEVGNRTTSSSGRMIARISFEVLEAIIQSATKRPVAICEFEPHMDSTDWKAVEKLSQTKILSLAKTTAKLNGTNLEGIMRRMLAEFEIVDAKKIDEQTNFQSLANIQFWKSLQSQLRGTQQNFEEARFWKTNKSVDRETASREAMELDKIALAYQKAFSSQWSKYLEFCKFVQDTNPKLTTSLPVADGEDILAIDPKAAALGCKAILATNERKKLNDDNDEISRSDLLKLHQITSQGLTYRIDRMSHPKPCREAGKKQWFSISQVDEWIESQKQKN